MEHRWGRRIAVDIPIHIAALVDAAAIRTARLANWSTTGALIEADFQLRVLSRVRIVFDGSVRLSNDVRSIDAYVARNHRHGIGVEWCELASPAVTQLLHAVSAAVSARGERAAPITSSIVAERLIQSATR